MVSSLREREDASRNAWACDVSLRARRRSRAHHVAAGGVRALGLPLPLALFSGVRASESTEEGRYRFEVEARLPSSDCWCATGTLDAAA